MMMMNHLLNMLSAYHMESKTDPVLKKSHFTCNDIQWLHIYALAILPCWWPTNTASSARTWATLNNASDYRANRLLITTLTTDH